MASPTPVRTIKKTSQSIDRTIEVKNEFDLFRSLLVEKAKAFAGAAAQGETDEVYLLSFHDDGVVWGKLDDKDELKTSDSVADSPSPEFRIETLQECHLFSKSGELLIWRTSETEFKTRQILDGGEFVDDEIESDGKIEYFDEPQVLWGREPDQKDESASEEFTVVREGQGVRHAFPKTVDESAFKSDEDESKSPRPLRLCVRHYLAYDDDGCAYVNLSRLLNVEVSKAQHDDED